MRFPERRHLQRQILRFIRAHEDHPSTEKAFNELAIEIFHFQYHVNPVYKKFCDLHGANPARIHAWNQIPAMPVSGFKELDITCFPVKNAKRTFRTSGTTETKRGRHYFDDLSLYQAAIGPAFAKYLLPDHQNLNYFFLIATSGQSPDSSLSFMMDEVKRRFAKKSGKHYVVGGQVRYSALHKDLQKARGPVMLLSTALALSGFLDHLAANKIPMKLPPRSRLMETGGFKGQKKEVSKNALYAACERWLGIPTNHCVSEYGMTELSSQYYDTTLWNAIHGIPKKSVKAGPAWMRAVVVDPETGKECRRGKVGLLKHVDLANLGSVVAIQTEDLGRAEDDGFQLLGRAEKSELRGCSLDYEAMAFSTR